MSAQGASAWTKILEAIIRPARLEDAEQLLAHLNALSNEAGIDIPLSPGEVKYTLEEERQIIADYALSENSVWLVAEVDGAVVAELSLKGGRLNAFRHSAMLGMAVAKNWRGQGIGSALMRAAVEWAHANPLIRRIELHVYVRNSPAIHLYRKYGFEFEGCRRSIIFQDGEYLDDYVMSLLL
jgi:ribosomal protein S18 acetylase RimI-like enzyme